MIKPVKEMLKYAYASKRYRLAASIAMLSEFDWYEDNLIEQDKKILQQIKAMMMTSNLSRKNYKPKTEPGLDLFSKGEVEQVKSKPSKPKREPKRFVKPTVEQIEAYCRERNNGVNAQQFVDFYEAKGWLIGKNPMKDWKAAVRTWEQRDGRGQKQQTKRGATPAPAEKIKLW